MALTSASDVAAARLGATGSRSRAEGAVRLVGLSLFPALLAFFAAVYAIDRPTYARLLREDGPVENLTAISFGLIAGASLMIARRSRRHCGRYPWFYAALAILSLLAALEEISWGQRLIGWDSPAFFLRHARQEETNAHNVVQKWTTLKVKDVAPVVFILYGIVLPVAATRSARIQRVLRAKGLAVPPRFLAGGFFLGSLLMLDRPTGREEEIAELVLSLCLLIFVVWQSLRRSGQPLDA